MAGRLSKSCQTVIQIDTRMKTSAGAKNKAKTKDKEVLKDIGITVLKTAGISLGVIGGIALVVPALGFGAAGVTGGSLAALYQSAFLQGTIAAGSAFAKMQSVGAAGLAVLTKLGIVGGSAVVASAHTACKRNSEKDEDNKKTTKNDEDNYPSPLVEIRGYGFNRVVLTRSVTTQTSDYEAFSGLINTVQKKKN